MQRRHTSDNEPSRPCATKHIQYTYVHDVYYDVHERVKKEKELRCVRALVTVSDGVIRG